MCWDGFKKFVVNISFNLLGVFCGLVVELIFLLFLYIEFIDIEFFEFFEIYLVEDIMVRR